MWSKQSRKSPHETSSSLLQPARKKINYAYSGSPDSPYIRRSISRLSNSDDIKRNLRNITDDDYDQGYSAPLSQVNFSRVTSPVAVTTITSSSPCNSIDSGFQSPTGLQSPPSGALSFSLASQLNSQSSPLLLNVSEKSHSLEEKDCELLVTPNAAARVESEFTTPSSAQVKGIAIKCQESSEHLQLIFTTSVQDKNQHSPDVQQNVLSTSSEKPCAGSVKIIHLNSLKLPSSSPSAAVLDTTSLQSTPTVNKDQSAPKDIVIEILKTQDFQTPNSVDSSKKKEAAYTQTPKSDPQFNKRPTHSYEKLIKAALNSRQDKRMTLKEIRQWVENTYPFYKNSPNPGWKDSIRHNLSVSKLFVKESPKYGSYWKLTSSLKEPAMSPQVSSGTECQTQVSNCNSPVSAVHVFNTLNKFPTGNLNPQPQVNFPSARQKVKLKKKGPLPILPRPSVDPQTYVLVPIQYFCNPSQNNIPLIPQLSSTQNTSGSTSFVPGSHVIAQSTSSRVPVTSTPISTSPDIDITAKDFLLYQQSSILSPLAPNQINTPNSDGQLVAKPLVLQSTNQPSCSVWSPERPKRICAKYTETTKSKVQESQLSERNIRRQKLPLDRKSRRKQKLVYKDLSLMDTSRSDIETTSPDNTKTLSQLLHTATNTSFNTLSTVKSLSSSGKDGPVLSPSQILLSSGKSLADNALVQTPTSSKKLMLDSFELSPNSLEMDSLKDGNLSDFISPLDNDLWEIW